MTLRQKKTIFCPAFKKLNIFFNHEDDVLSKTSIMSSFKLKYY